MSVLRHPVRSIKGLVGLVTGGASGLGQAVVENLLKNGGRVIICDLPTTNGEELAKSLGERAAFVPVDVRSESDVEKAIQVTKDKFGRLDVAVNCAGVAMYQRTFDFKKKQPGDLKVFQNVIEVNLVGTFNVIRLAVGLMAENEPDADGQRGVVVNTASVAAFDGQVDQTAYASSKAGVCGMTLPLAREFASQGIRVVTIAPGLFRTPLLEKLPVEKIRELEKNVPNPSRLGHPSEFAHLVQTIVENPMFNGETIRIDGALRMQP